MNIERRSPPTKLDTCPKGTLCTVNLYEEDISVVYIQMNENEEDPRWRQLDEAIGEDKELLER
jgi:hypothetical protein